jgi:RNase P/RNase MRP subunit POP5
MSKRYFLIKVISAGPLSGEQFELALVDSVRRLFGEFGLARIHPRLLRYDTTNFEAIVACTKEGAEDLQAAIGLIDGTPEVVITAMTTRVSGTIRGLRGKERF